jgi:tRNA threonylcarbamoyladenosine biosynthesis protein TsaB
VAAYEHGALKAGATLVLAIESATVTPSVALLGGEDVLALRAARGGVDAAEFVLPAIEAVLADARAILADITLFAVAIGPGSFTGLRVGLATVKGLAFGTGTPVAPVPTLAALCLAAGSEASPVAALLDARRGEVYAAAFGPGGSAPGEFEILPEGLYTPSTLLARLPRGCRFIGDGAALHRDALVEAGFEVEATGTSVDTGAEGVGRLGLRLEARGLARPAADLVPNYLRRAEAEARRTGEPLERKNPF